jgi:hypothetical protein
MDWERTTDLINRLFENDIPAAEVVHCRMRMGDE